MNKKLRNALAISCKDFGLTDKALDELAKIGSEGLDDESSEDDIKAKADLLVPYAKAMQGEITRKTRKEQNNNEPSKNTQSSTEGAKEGEASKPEGVPAWMEEYMKPFKDSILKLQNENDSLKLEKAANERKSAILAKADEMSIPRFLIENYAFKDDADIEKELTAFKQKLVNEQLLPKSATVEKGNLEDSLKASANAWADKLPNA